ncbi:Alkaline protease secretion ATP-binding protein AprD [Nymphon striatum]|nr:Alkaline protease secretion ATP-binding protein AprD [Nymphon striatum]
MIAREPTRAEIKAGQVELLKARKRSRGLYWSVAIFSSFVNALLLTGPLYMLNVYGSVLGSRSFETLVALSVLAAFMYLMMGILDYARGLIMGRIGAQFQTDLDERVYNASMRAKATGYALAEAATGQRDLQAIRQSITAPVAMAKFDLPWTAIFLLGIFIFHAYLGYLAIAGGALLVGIAVMNQMSTKRPLEAANIATLRSEIMGEQLRSNADTIQALGMRGAAFQRWNDLRKLSLSAGIRAGGFCGRDLGA